MRVLLLLSFLWGPSIQAHSEQNLTSEVIYPNTPDPHRNNPSVNPTPDPIDEKNFEQTLKAVPRNPSSVEKEPKYHTSPKSRTSRPLGPNKK